jgi:catechol 2,3-dioxygenase-like lactoylglutathione lyase family enzyme
LRQVETCGRPRRIAQIELHCTDLSEAEAFYCEVLGVPKVARLGDSLFVRCAETNLIIQASRNPKLPGSMVYFGADNAVDEATAELRGRGVLFSQEPRRIARVHQGFDIWLGFFADPWGNPLALLANMPIDSA